MGYANQSMTEAVFLTLGQSQNSHFEKLGLRLKAYAEVEGTRNSFSTSNNEVEYIKYNLLDFCI